MMLMVTLTLMLTAVLPSGERGGGCYEQLQDKLAQLWKFQLWKFSKRSQLCHQVIFKIYPYKVESSEEKSYQPTSDQYYQPTNRRAGTWRRCPTVEEEGVRTIAKAEKCQQPFQSIETNRKS